MPRRRLYAEGTQVDPARSRMELEHVLRRYGADAFSYGTEGARSVVVFRVNGRVARFEVEVPDADAARFRLDGAGRVRGPAARETAQAAEERRLWRALVLVIKAKLEAVESGLLSFEEEFMANLLLPSGETFGDWAVPQLEDVYESGEMPSTLPGAARELPETVG